MSDEIRVGDRFEITVEAMGTAPPGGSHECRLPDGYTTLISQKALLNGRRLPRPVKVGGKVKWTPPNDTRGLHVERWRVVAIDDGMAALAGWPPNSVARQWAPVSDLTPGDEK